MILWQSQGGRVHPQSTGVSDAKMVRWVAVGTTGAGAAADDVVPLWQLINGFTYQTYGLRV